MPRILNIRAAYVRDALGRETGYTEYQANGTTVGYARTDTFNARSQITSETTSSVIGADTYVTTTSNDYTAESGTNVWTGAYQGGVVTHARTTTLKNNALQATADTRNTYAWWDGARQATIAIATDNVSATDTSYTTTYSYDTLGHLTQVVIADGRPRTVTFVTSAEGTILQRDEADEADATGDPREVYYYLDGVRLGEFLKYGISVNPEARYPRSFMVGKDIYRITSGTRADMLALERQMVVSNPGPLNREPWALKVREGN